MNIERRLNLIVVGGIFAVSLMGIYHSEKLVNFFSGNSGKNIDLIDASCGTSIEANVGDRVRLTRDRFVDIENDGLEVRVAYETSADFVDVFDGQVVIDEGDTDLKTWQSTFTNTSRFNNGKLFVSKWSVVSMKFDSIEKKARADVVCN